MADSVTSISGINKVKAVSKTAKTDKDVEPTVHTKTTDHVQLTKTLESIERLSNALAEGEAVDTAKIERIRNAIASGEYQVDADRIAKKFIELEKMLGK